MKGIIAFCKNPQCGAIFEHRGIVGGTGKANITFVNSSIGPCPVCGGLGDIPDGVYKYFDDHISFIKGPQSSVESLEQVKLLLRQFKTEAAPKEEILKQIKSIAPEVADKLEKAPSKVSHHQWIATMIALVTVWILVQQTYFKEKSDSDIKDKFIEFLLEENKSTQEKEDSTELDNRKQ